LFAPGTQFIDDESLRGYEEVRTFLWRHSEALAQFSRRPAWYLQQYIKLATRLTLEDFLIFIADGDTIFSRTLLKTVLTIPTMLTTGENHPNYDRLLLAMGVVPPSRSCVANGNFFRRDPLICELATPAGFLSMIEEKVIASRGALDLSEYQLAGGLLEPTLGSRRIRMFRRFDLVRSHTSIPKQFLTASLERFDAVAFEFGHHDSVRKRLAAKILYALGYSW
jgi:hypothetical protein